MNLKELAFCGLCAFTGGMVMVAALDTGIRVGAETERTVVRADEFVLQGKDGKVRARLGLDEEGSPNLWLTDVAGTSYAKFDDVEKPAKDKIRVEALRKHIEALGKKADVADTEIRVAHILIAFAGAANSTQPRSKDEAEALAAEIYARVLKGEDFNDLIKTYSSDPGPGIYTMSTNARPPQGVYPRNGMVPAFGNVGWKLAVGEIGVAAHDAANSPFGWHIIKRLPLTDEAPAK